MTASIIGRNTESMTIQIQIPLSSRSLLESEETIQKVLNEAGTLATGETLKQFDTDGSAIEVAGAKWTSKGKLPKTYQTPYGTVEIQRHVYQRSVGGATKLSFRSGWTHYRHLYTTICQTNQPQVCRVWL